MAYNNNNYYGEHRKNGSLVSITMKEKAIITKVYTNPAK
jgi:hypothetical protein